MAWLSSLVGGVVLFHALGSGPLAPPPLTDPASWSTWASAREPIVATIAVLRLVVLGLAWYLVGVTTIGIVARLTRAARLIRLADALTVPGVRRLLRGALGMGLATAMVGGVADPTGGGPSPPAIVGSSAATAGSHARALAHPRVVEQHVGAHTRHPYLLVRDEAARTADHDDSEARLPFPLRLLGDAGSEASSDELTMRRIDGDGDTTLEPSLHEVVTGESMWTIARDTLAGARGKPPTEPDLHEYWQRLLAVNRERFADPTNPDLIFPGQVFELPPVATRDEAGS